MPDSDGAAAVRRFYETYGWQRGPSGAYRDAEAFVDLRPVMRGYHRRRDRRVARQLAGPGPLLDIGCGGAPVSIQTDGELRVNLDFSAAALTGARQQQGGSARYVQADACRLPFPANTFGRVVCAHVLYHIPPRRQRLALTEIHRVLRPGGVAVIVYLRQSAPLHRLAERLGRYDDPLPELPQLPAWVIDHRRLQADLRDRMRIEVRTWSILETGVTRGLVPGGWVGRVLLAGVSAIEELLPHGSVRFARYPMLVIRKAAAPAGDHEPVRSKR
ncbi:MAG TPA: class I SAM-dependent methyltransferase [Natronosporangium sp.]